MLHPTLVVEANPHAISGFSKQSQLICMLAVPTKAVLVLRIDFKLNDSDLHT